MKYIPLVLATLVSTSALGQKPKAVGNNNICLSFTPNYYLQKQNIKNGSDDFLFPKNTFGYDFSLEYDRTTKYNLILGIGLDYGQLSHNIDIIQPLDNFDPEAAEAFKGLKYSGNVSATTKYFAPKLVIGYKYPISKNFSLNAKVGLRRTIFLNGYRVYNYGIYVRYLPDSGEPYRESIPNTAFYYFGNDKSQPSASKLFPWNQWNNNWEFYFGASKKIDKLWIKSVDFGINFKETFGKINSPSLTDEHITRYGEETYQLSYYYERNIAFGLVLGVTF